MLELPAASVLACQSSLCRKCFTGLTVLPVLDWPARTVLACHSSLCWIGQLEVYWPTVPPCASTAANPFLALGQSSSAEIASYTCTNLSVVSVLELPAVPVLACQSSLCWNCQRFLYWPVSPPCAGTAPLVDSTAISLLCRNISGMRPGILLNISTYPDKSRISVSKMRGRERDKSRS